MWSKLNLTCIMFRIMRHFLLTVINAAQSCKLIFCLKETWLIPGLSHWCWVQRLLCFLCVNSFESSVLETQSQTHIHKSWCWVLNQSGPTVPLRTRQPLSKAACAHCLEATVLPAAGVGMEVDMPCTRSPLPRQMTKNVFSLTKEVWHTLRRSATKPQWKK